MLLMVGLVCFTAVLPPSSLHAQAEPLPVADYWQQLADLRALVADLQADEEADYRVALTQAAADLETITAVTLPDGRTLPMQSTFLVNQLTAAEPDLERITHLLDSLLAEQALWPAGGVPYDPAVLAGILAREEFNYTPETENFWQRLWRDFNRQLQELLVRFLEFTGLGGVLPTALNVVGAVVLAFVTYYAIRGLVADFSASSRLDDEGLDGEFLTADLALKRAEELSTGGDYRTAVRYLYLSSLLLLEERGLLRYDRSLTNREYLRTIAHQPRLTAVLRQVIDVFDRVWYGFQPISKESYEAYARQVDSLKQQKGEGE
ncbi:MAG: DUF4129 domain-containing protein [Anaerolineae bacterium]|nr:DUF4129 domain-containing protein [Anaerolineae bacterium]